jgi:hypothetical protein
MAGVGGAAVPGRLSLAGTEARPTELFSYEGRVKQVNIRIVGRFANRPYIGCYHKTNITFLRATWYQADISLYFWDMGESGSRNSSSLRLIW